MKNLSKKSSRNNDISVKYILTYYLANYLNKRDIPKHFENINSDEYINQITEYIDNLNINTKFSKSFLEDNGKYELLSKLNKR